MKLSWVTVCTVTVFCCSAQDEDLQPQRRQFVEGGRRQGQAGRAGCVVDGISMCGYETHQQMIGRLRNIQQRNPNIAKVGSIGTSVRGKPLVFLKLSGNVNKVDPTLYSYN